MWSELLGAVDWNSDGNVVLIIVGRVSSCSDSIIGHAGD